MNNLFSKAAILKYFVVLFAILAAFAVFTGVFFAVNRTGVATETASTPKPFAPEGGQAVSSSPGNTASPSNPFDNFYAPPARTNVIVMGTDKNGSLTDVMMLVTFNAVEGKLDIISLPRDSLVTLTTKEKQFLQNINRPVPSSGSMKLNEMHSFAGKKDGAEFLRTHLVDYLGVQIDYYVEINLKAFRDIVDLIGGVEFTVRPQGYYYDDPEQGLHIAIPGGKQVLDGKLAEGLVRYRHDYRQGDLDRMEVQKEFMKAFVSQVLANKELMSDIPTLISTFVSYVSTNFSVTNIPRYLNSIKDFKAEDITFSVLPGEAQKINNGSYYILDTAETKKLIDRIFYEPSETPAASETPSPSPTPLRSDKDLRIQVLNGGDTSGMAAKTRDTLRAAGYTVTKADDYTGTKVSITRIMVREDWMGESLLPFFKDAEIKVDTAIADCDIIIIIGKGE